jgi:hypothetical protein
MYGFGVIYTFNVLERDFIHLIVKFIEKYCPALRSLGFKIVFKFFIQEMGITCTLSHQLQENLETRHD